MDEGALLLIARSTGGLLMCVAGGVLATKMLRLARRTRALPEMAIGLHMVALVLGYLIEFAGIQIAEVSPTGGVWLRGSANLLYAASIFAYLLFTWKVFLPQSRVASGLVVLMTLALGVGWTGEVLTCDFGFDTQRFERPWFWLAFIPRMIGMGWASLEAIRHHSKLRLRLALGLADPVATNRILLWALAALCEWLIYSVVAIAILTGEPDGYLLGDAALWVSAFGVGASACMWLGFFPPRQYRLWLTSRTAPDTTSPARRR
jgi:hypothetical protein